MGAHSGLQPRCRSFLAVNHLATPAGQLGSNPTWRFRVLSNPTYKPLKVVSSTVRSTVIVGYQGALSSELQSMKGCLGESL